MFPVELEIIKELWLPNIYIYNLKNFKAENHGFPLLSGIWLSSKEQLDNIKKKNIFSTQLLSYLKVTELPSATP